MKNKAQIFKVLFWSAVAIIDAALILSGGLCIAIIGTAVIAYMYYLIAPLIISFIEQKMKDSFLQNQIINPISSSLQKIGLTISTVLICSLIIFLILVYIIATGNRTFKGKVVDADTKKPIIGAVVVASWIGESPGVAGISSRSVDVKETLTDENGEWSIKGPRGKNDFLLAVCGLPNLFTGTYSTIPPEFVVFKPGYCSWPGGFGIESCKGKIKPVGNNKIIEGEIVEVPKLTSRSRETLSSNIPFVASEEKEKIPIFNKLLDEDLGYRVE
jgi:hypothetical protein